VRLVSVQAGPGREQLASCGFPVSDAAGDLEDLAAVLRCVDLFVGCDSAPAHLAGALRVPAVLLLPRLADPRWSEGGPPPHRTHLYPSLAVAQLGPDGDSWEDLLGQAADQLEEWLAGRLPPAAGRREGGERAVTGG
jgi:ADP-heptose:LPS heptosyltransferase